MRNGLLPGRGSNRRDLAGGASGEAERATNRASGYEKISVGSEEIKKYYEWVRGSLIVTGRGYST